MMDREPLPYWAPSEPCPWDTLDALRARIAQLRCSLDRTDVSKPRDQKLDSFLASLETSVRKGEAERKEREAREAYDRAVAARRETAALRSGGRRLRRGSPVTSSLASPEYSRRS
jgi:hypothetical protein